MSLDLESGSSQYAFTASPALTDQPFTLAGWFKAESLAAYDFMGLYDTAAAAVNFMSCNRLGANQLRATTNAAGTASSAVQAADLTVGVWAHMLAHFGPTTGTDRAVTKDGATFTTNTTNRAAAGMDTIAIGAEKDATPSGFFDGLVACVTVWNVQLVQGEALALARGAHPFMVRPSAIRHFWPLFRDGSDWGRANAPLTLNGSPSFSGDSPPVAKWPGRPQYRPRPKPA